MESAGFCAHCGVAVFDGFKFCSGCGRPVSPGVAESARRQITVLFCDMVDSTRFSERLDPEDVSDLFNGFQRLCRDSITRHGGSVWQNLGDGVLAYFGYPAAHEDDAVRALRASLNILDTIKLLNQGIGKRLDVEVRARIGVHTGVVAIGSGLGGAFGETVNLAARIETFAPVDTVLASAATVALAGGQFEVESLKSHTLRGFSRPVELFRVLRATGPRARFEAVPGKLTPHVGREEELGKLGQAWHAVEGGESRIVLVRGEAGIGKSRLMHQLRQSVLEEGVMTLQCFCAPLLQANAFAPIIEMLDRRIVERANGQTQPSAKYEALVAMLSDYSRFGPDALPLIASLLSIPGADEAPVRDLSPLRRRLRTLELLREWLGASAERIPVVLFFEDIHWADPSTLDFLDLLVREGPGPRTLVCLTARPEFDDRWQGAAVQTIELSRLRAAECDAMIAAVDGAHALGPSVGRHITERSEGVPLFVEELTKLALDRLRGNSAGFTSDEQLLPTTLRGALEARLDQVGAGRQVAQLGAAIGREFTYALIREVAGGDEAQLGEHLRSLSQSELAFVQGEPPNAVYTFKHALIQEAIYETIPRSKRDAVHERIFKALVSSFPQLLTAQPEIAAYHAERANQRDAAVRLLAQAGLQALGRMAVAEAARYLGRAIGLVDALPEPARTETEAELRAAIGPAYMATLGWHAEEVEHNSERLLVLARQRGDRDKEYQAMWGAWTVHFVRGDQHRAIELAREVYATAKASGVPPRVITGCHALGYTSYYRAELENARTLADEALAISTPEIERILATEAQLSSGAIIHNFCAAACWLLGEQKRAERLVGACHELLDYLKHPPSTALSLAFEGYVLHMQRDPGKLRELALRLRTLAEQEGFRIWIPMSHVFEAWARAELGEVDAAIPQIEGAIADWLAMKTGLTMCDNRVMQAEVLLRGGRAEDALGVIESGKQFCRESGERTLEPELHRLEGEARALLGQKTAALEATRHAIDRARELRALSLELRAALQADRLAPSAASLADLGRVYRQFSEGFEYPELSAARARLEQAGIHVEQTIVH